MNYNFKINNMLPTFLFPNPKSENGNPNNYFKMACDKLKTNKFYKESEELNFLVKSQPPYSQHQFILDQFFNVLHEEDITKEIDGYIVTKVPKETQEQLQSKEFLNPKILELINNNYDFSHTNSYGRTILHYLNDFEQINLLLQKNKEKKYFYIFDLDSFNNSYLYNRTNFSSFYSILKEMYDENPDLTSIVFTGTNVFEQNASGQFLKNMDILFSKQLSTEPHTTINETELFYMQKCLNIVNKINPEMGNKILTHLVQFSTPKKENLFKYHESFLKTIQEIIKDLINPNLENKTGNTKSFKKI